MIISPCTPWWIFGGTPKRIMPLASRDEQHADERVGDALHAPVSAVPPTTTAVTVMNKSRPRSSSALWPNWAARGCRDAGEEARQRVSEERVPLTGTPDNLAMSSPPPIA